LRQSAEHISERGGKGNQVSDTDDQVEEKGGNLSMEAISANKKNSQQSNIQFRPNEELGNEPGSAVSGVPKLGRGSEGGEQKIYGLQKNREKEDK